MVMTDNEAYAKKMRIFRNHGITSDHREREAKGTCYYEMIDLGFNYRLTDLQCALGISQLKHLNAWIIKRNEIAAKYDKAFAQLSYLKIQQQQVESIHAHHLYVVRLQKGKTSRTRDEVLKIFRDMGIIANVHYPPVHLHPYYQRNLRTHRGQLPVTESVYEELISLPMFPTMKDAEVETVIQAVQSLAQI